VYHHFGKKPDLMVAVHRANEERYMSRILAAVEQPPGFRAKVAALLDVIHETMRDDPEMVSFYAVAQDEARRHPELRAIEEDRTFANLFVDLVDAAVREGVVAKADASRARGAIVAVASGLALMSHLSIEAHRTATDGAKQLLAGDLLTT
jgi:AcrR family transcriptional regulator